MAQLKGPLRWFVIEKCIEGLLDPIPVIPIKSSAPQITMKAMGG